LEKIRFQDTLKVAFTSSEIDENIQIAPMLLIPFVENAFKHGSIINGFLRIEINVKVINNQLEFYVGNTVLKGNQKKKTSGIGLENIQKRLELNYAGNYKLISEIENMQYVVKLSIFDLKTIQHV
jgi:hypothetical protein